MDVLAAVADTSTTTSAGSQSRAQNQAAQQAYRKQSRQTQEQSKKKNAALLKQLQKITSQANKLDKQNKQATDAANHYKAKAEAAESSGLGVDNFITSAWGEFEQGVSDFGNPFTGDGFSFGSFFIDVGVLLLITSALITIL